MILRFATKRNVNGNRHYLAVDFEQKTFAREPRQWYCREDFAEVSLRDIRALIVELQKNGFQEVGNL